MSRLAGAPRDPTPAGRGRHRLGLRAILYLAFPLALAALLLSFGLLLTRSVQSALREGLEARGHAILHNLVARALLPLTRQQAAPAEAVFDEVFQDPEVSFAVILTPEGQPLAQRVRENARPQFEDLQRLYATSAAGSSFQAHRFLCLQAPVREAIPSAPGSLRGYVYLGLSTRSVEALGDDLRRKILASLVAGIALFSVIVLWISRRYVIRPLVEMTRAANQVSAYDLTVRLGAGATEMGGEFGILAEAMERIVRNLSGTVARTRGVTEALAEVTGQIGDNSNAVAHGAQTTFASADETAASMAELLASLRGVGRSVEVLEESAKETSREVAGLWTLSEQWDGQIRELSTSVQETGESVEQMTFSIKDVATNIESLSGSAAETSASMTEMDREIGLVGSNADETARLSEQVQQDAETGVAALQKTLAGLSDIQANSSAASEVITGLREKILAVADTLAMVDEVSEQTNLLALNAAIIAAQAGEHGRGFGVVADEIKELAERTSISTREIANVVRSIEDEAVASVAAMQRGTASVEVGVRLGQEAAAALKKIEGSARAQVARVREIARATVGQALQSKRAVESVARIARSAQEIAKATADQARGSEQIVRSAGRMREITREAQRALVEAGRGTRRITAAMERIALLVRELREAEATQAQSSEQVMTAIDNIRRVAEAQRETIPAMEQAIEELRTQSEILQVEVLRFRV